MRTALVAGLAYVGLVYLAGFALGTIRTLALAPWLGETAAVIIEVPIILAVSWLVCGAVISRFDVPAQARHRIMMGVVALVLLLAMEAAMGVLLLGRSVPDVLAGFGTASGLIGLGAQLVFAALPLVRLQEGRTSGSPERP